MVGLFVGQFVCVQGKYAPIKRMNKWTNESCESMDGWMDGWMRDRLMNPWMDGFECLGCRCVHEWMDACMCIRMSHRFACLSQLGRGDQVGLVEENRVRVENLLNSLGVRVFSLERSTTGRRCWTQFVSTTGRRCWTSPQNRSGLMCYNIWEVSSLPKVL